jgi:hypothetical protein
MDERAMTVLTTGKTYEVEYTNDANKTCKQQGRLISLDEEGFVVLEKDGNRILINKERVDIDLLSASLTIPLVCCHINHFRRAASCGGAMARRRKEEKWAGLASRGMRSDGVVPPPVCRHQGVPARRVVPERCHASGESRGHLQ